jgi:hypothetical protein
VPATASIVAAHSGTNLCLIEFPSVNVACNDLALRPAAGALAAGGSMRRAAA